MKTLRFSLPVMLLTGFMASCSNNTDVSEPRKEDGAIRFSAHADYATKAGDITTNNLKQFNVYAYTGAATSPSVFMDNVTVSKTGTNSWTYSPLQYWPAGESVDFYAYAPSTWVGDKSPLGEVPFTVDAMADQDLVYAVNPDLSSKAGVPAAQVVFNFRHALSKISVKMSSSDANLKVKVSNLVLANVASTANFTFPRESTSGAATDTNTGSWSGFANPMLVLIHMASSPTDVIELSNVPVDMTTTNLGTDGKYLIPQPLSFDGNGNSQSDEYITVMCSVYDSDTGVKLWPNANTPAENIVEGSINGDGLLKFPLGTSQFSAWKPGYHYVYNIVINANDDMSPIQFGQPSVDTFVDVTTNYE